MAQASLFVCFCPQYFFKMLYVSDCLGCYLFRNKNQSVAEIFKNSNIKVSIFIHPLKAPLLLNSLFSGFLIE